jgi:hypothetical protein
MQNDERSVKNVGPTSDVLTCYRIETCVLLAPLPLPRRRRDANLGLGPVGDLRARERAIGAKLAATQ